MHPFPQSQRHHGVGKGDPVLRGLLIRHSVSQFPRHLFFHCEDPATEYLASRGVNRTHKSSPVAKPIWDQSESSGFGKQRPMDFVPAASTYL